MLNLLSANRRSQGGMVLLEGLVSILIFAVGVLGIVGLQAKSVQNAAQATYRADAGFYANQAIAQTMAGVFTLSSWQTEIAGGLPNGTGAVTTTGNQVRVVVSWRMPSEPSTTTHNVTVIGQVCLNPNATGCI